MIQRRRMRAWAVAVALSLLFLLGSACGAEMDVPQSTDRILEVQSDVTGALAEPSAATELSATTPPPTRVVASPMPDPTATTAPAPLNPTDVAPPTPVMRTATVEAGDTLLGIAMAYDVPMAAIQLQNDLGESTIVQVGQVLEIPPAEAWDDASPFWIIHEVVEGETLSELAARYGLTVSGLASLNGFADANVLAIGQVLILPINAPEEAVAAAHRPSGPPPPPATATPVPEVVVEATAAPEPASEIAASADGGEAQPAPTAAPPAEVTPTPAPTAAPAIPDAATPADVAALPGVIYRLLNEQRAAHGLPPLAWSDTLARAAQRHANDCEARGWCSHTGSDGSHYKARIIREGYDPARWSECWAWYGSPEQAVAMWMDETPPNDPHRRTILSTYLTEVGVGVVPGNGFGYYFIADFGTPR